MHIMLFGGAFDPPHLGHHQVVSAVLAAQHADQVWIVPTKHHPFGKTISPDDDRVAMINHWLAVGQPVWGDRVRLEDSELHQAGKSYSYHTLTTLKAAQPDDTFSWLIGSDNLPEFPRWHAYQQLLSEFKVFVYPRANQPMSPLLPGMQPLTDVPEVATSSTQVRRAVAAKQSINELCLPEVAAYIGEHGLYQTE